MCLGGGWGVIWSVHLEASSQYQFVVRVEDLRHTLQRERVQMAGDIILLIVPASEITHRHPPFYCRSFKRDISDINPEPLIILSSLCKYCPVSLQQYKNQSQAQDALADSLNQKQAEVGVLHPVLCFLSDNQIPDQTPVLVTSQHQALSCSPPPQPDFHPI